MEKGLALAKEKNADLLLATDPDADRVGIAMRTENGEYELVSGNEMGVLLLDYIAAGRTAEGTLPKNPIAGQVHCQHTAGRQGGCRLWSGDAPHLDRI